MTRERLHEMFKVIKVRCEECNKSRNPHKDLALEFYYVGEWQLYYCSDCIDEQLTTQAEESL